MLGLRRWSLLAAVALVAATAAPALAQAPAAAPPSLIRADDMMLGNPKAKVVVVEYASLSCPHCAHFNNEIFPAFKKKYIDSGKVRYVYREFLTEPSQLAAAAAMTARCAGPKRYFDVIDAFFRAQAEVYASGKARDALMSSGKAGGLTEAKIEACLKDEAGQNALLARVERNSKDDIEATPTFVVNGKKLEGDHQLADLDAAIGPLLAK